MQATRLGTDLVLGFGIGKAATLPGKVGKAFFGWDMAGNVSTTGQGGGLRGHGTFLVDDRYGGNCPQYSRVGRENRSGYCHDIRGDRVANHG